MAACAAAWSCRPPNEGMTRSLFLRRCVCAEEGLQQSTGSGRVARRCDRHPPLSRIRAIPHARVPIEGSRTCRSDDATLSTSPRDGAADAGRRSRLQRSSRAGSGPPSSERRASGDGEDRTILTRDDRIAQRAPSTPTSMRPTSPSFRPIVTKPFLPPIWVTPTEAFRRSSSRMSSLLFGVPRTDSL